RALGGAHRSRADVRAWILGPGGGRPAHPINRPEMETALMRYLVTATVKPGREGALERAIEEKTLGRGSVAGDEYLRNMEAAVEREDGRGQWGEGCSRPTPPAERAET